MFVLRYCYFRSGKKRLTLFHVSVHTKLRRKASHSPPDGSSVHVDSETDADCIELTEHSKAVQQQEEEDKCIENVAEFG